jgi:Arc/MetJ-type ribon-helix-helix transcriptional regulator
MREPRPNRRSWDRRHRISDLLREALRLAQEESYADHEDRNVIALTVRLGVLHEDALELEEKALARRQTHDRDRSD